MRDIKQNAQLVRLNDEAWEALKEVEMLEIGHYWKRKEVYRANRSATASRAIMTYLEMLRKEDAGNDGEFHKK